RASPPQGQARRRQRVHRRRPGDRDRARARLTPTISSRTLAKLVETLGVARIEIETTDDPEARVPLARLHEVWETVTDEAASLAVAKSYAPSDYGLLGYVAMTSATLGQAIDQMVRHSRLWMDEPAIERTSDTVLRLAYKSK